MGAWLRAAVRSCATRDRQRLTQAQHGGALPTPEMTDAQLAERSNLAQAALCCVFATAEFGGLHAVAIAATGGRASCTILAAMRPDNADNWQGQNCLDSGTGIN